MGLLYDVAGLPSIWHHLSLDESSHSKRARDGKRERAKLMEKAVQAQLPSACQGPKQPVLASQASRVYLRASHVGAHNWQLSIRLSGLIDSLSGNLLFLMTKLLVACVFPFAVLTWATDALIDCCHIWSGTDFSQQQHCSPLAHQTRRIGVCWPINNDPSYLANFLL